MQKKKFRLQSFLALLLAIILAVPLFSVPAEAASKPSVPAITKIVNTSSGVTVTWKKVSGATGYYVYRKTTGGYTKIATIKKNITVTYTDKKAAAGKTYTYAVKAYKGKTASSYGKTAKIKRLTQPSVKVANTSSGIKVSWGKVTGASKYRIYYKKDGKWVTLTDTTSTSYTDKSIKSGTSRTYTVKAISGSYCSSYCTGVTATYTHTHSYTEKITKQPTCTTAGVKTYTCACGDTYTKSIAATGHNYTSAVTKAATCEADGVKTYTCKNCGHSYTEVIPKTGHNYTSAITKAATCTEDGIKTYTCKNCGKTYIEVIPKIGHSYSSAITKAATCTEDGVKTYTCKSCGHSYTEVIPKIGHSYSSAITKAATCTEDGIKTYTCKNCGDSYTEIIPALGHEWEDITTKQWVVDGKVWVVDQEAYDEEVETYKPYHQCTACKQKWYYEAGNSESNIAALDAWSEHDCPAGGGSYTTRYDVVITTIHHDEEGHYEDTGHYETVVTGKKCTRCGLEEMSV